MPRSYPKISREEAIKQILKSDVKIPEGVETIHLSKILRETLNSMGIPASRLGTWMEKEHPEFGVNGRNILNIINGGKGYGSNVHKRHVKGFCEVIPKLQKLQERGQALPDAFTTGDDTKAKEAIQEADVKLKTKICKTFGLDPEDTKNAYAAFKAAIKTFKGALKHAFAQLSDELPDIFSDISPDKSPKEQMQALLRKDLPDNKLNQVVAALGKEEFQTMVVQRRTQKSKEPRDSFGRREEEIKEERNSLDTIKADLFEKNGKSVTLYIEPETQPEDTLFIKINIVMYHGSEELFSLSQSSPFPELPAIAAAVILNTVKQHEATHLINLEATIGEALGTVKQIINGRGDPFEEVDRLFGVTPGSTVRDIEAAIYKPQIREVS